MLNGAIKVLLDIFATVLSSLFLKRFIVISLARRCDFRMICIHQKVPHASYLTLFPWKPDHASCIVFQVPEEK